MPNCFTCNKHLKSEKGLDQHAIDKGHAPRETETETERKIRVSLTRINKNKRIEREIIKKEIIKGQLERYMKKTIDPSHIVGFKPIKPTHIPIHEEPQEKRKSSSVCKTLRNLHR
jgi:hypothetical protein